MKFGPREKLKAAFETTYPHSPINSIRGIIPWFHKWRGNLYRNLMLKDLQLRDPEGNIDWEVYFQLFGSTMPLSKPLKRADLFPNGTEGLSIDAILQKISKTRDNLLMRKSPYYRLTTDVAEFPEIVDEDFRDIVAAINQNTFMRTYMCCSGHFESDEGYAYSYMTITLDRLNGKTPQFLDGVRQFIQEFEKKHPNAVVLADEFNYDSVDLDNFIDFRISLCLSENESSNYSHSDECRELRDDFWNGIKKIAKK